jgi:branched-chain amino acid aminotransferase
MKSVQGVTMNSPVSRSALTGGTAYIDDQFVPISEARIPILDWGFLHSDATYDVVHVWQGSFFRLDDHLDRFLRGMQRLHMSLPHNRDRIREILFECVKLSGLQDAYVELICTRGVPTPGSRDPRQCINRFYAFAVPFVWIANPEKQKEGLHLIISQVHRIPETSIDPTIKNYHWLDLVAGLYEAYSRGGETAILSDHEGNVIEGAGFNIFVVKKGKITTPARGVLEGITRRTVIEMGQMLNIPVETRNVSAEQIRQADEVFITSTAGGIMPVTKVDSRLLGDGKPGLITLQLHKQYWSLHQDSRYVSPIQYVP